MYRENSTLVSYLYGFLSFVKSIFLFEDAQIDKAVKDLDQTQKQCKDVLKKISSNIKKVSNDPTKVRLSLFC
jgi:hypothetical protein